MKTSVILTLVVVFQIGCSGKSESEEVSKENDKQKAAIAEIEELGGHVQIRDETDKPITVYLDSPDVKEGANVRMAQLRDGPRLTLKPLFQGRIRCDTLGQHFDGHSAVQPRVVGFIHLSHASSAEEGFYLEMAEGCAGREGHELQEVIASAWHGM